MLEICSNWESSTHACLSRGHQQRCLLAVAKHCKAGLLVHSWLAFPDHHIIHRLASLLHVCSVMSIRKAFNLEKTATGAVAREDCLVMSKRRPSLPSSA